MTPDEKTLLTSFLDDLAAKPAVSKDAEAAALISDRVGRNPDAAYLLVQHAIVSDRALHAAQARIAELESQLRQQQAPVPSPQPSFTSSFAGPWGPSPAAPAASAPSAFSSGGGLGSFLRQAGTTAAGVAGGEFLFEGLSNMFGGHRDYGGGGFGGQGFLGGGQENVTINNYGDSNDDGGLFDNGSSFDSGDGNW